MGENISSQKIDRVLNNRIFLIRHGRTFWNKEGRIQGSLDSFLLPDSIKQLKEIGRYFYDIDFDYIYHSPLKRVLDSIKYIGFSSGMIKEMECLREINHGIYEGKKLEEIDTKWYLERKKDIWNIKWPNGESYKDVSERLDRLFSEINYKNKTIGIVAHEGVNRILIKKLFNLDENIFLIKQPNTVIYIIEDGKLSLVDVSSNA